MKPPGGRWPRIPTWAIAVVVFATLGGSAYLFFHDTGADEDAAPNRGGPSSESVLKLPDDEAASRDDDSRRGDSGRDRIDSEDATSSTTDDPDDDSETTDPAELRLTGVRIALVAADAGPPEAAAAKTAATVGGVRTTCAATAPRASALVIERRLLDQVTAALQRQGASVDRIDGTDRRAPCVAERVAALESADVALVMSVATPGSSTLVAPGVPAKGSTAADHTLARRVANDLAAATALPVSGDPLPSSTRSTLAQHGAIDLPGGAPVIWLSAAAETAADSRAARVFIDGIVSALAPD